MLRSLPLVLLLLLAAHVVRADDGVRPSRTRVHHLGLRLDTDGERWAPGLGYMHSHEFAWADRGGRSWMAWVGYGVDGVAVIPAAASVDAGMGLAVLRGGIFHRVGGLGLEVAAGAAGDRFSARGVAEAGVFVSLYYLDVGYTVQLPMGPFDRPLWMPLHRVGIRLRIPVARIEDPAH
ncbi:MAG: hypothetical protein ABIK09_13565 [Pseudomonadota bacterium]